MPSNPSKGSYRNLSQPSSSISQKKTRWEPLQPSEKSDQRSPPRPFSDPLSFMPGSVAASSLPDLQSGRPFQPPDVGPPPPPSYGFHNLERRTIVLADGSVRSYFALPPDEYPPVRSMPDHLGPRSLAPFSPIEPPHFPGAKGSPDPLRREDHGGTRDYWTSLGLDARPLPDTSLKRKYEEEDRGRDDLSRQRLHVSQYGNPDSNGLPSLAADRLLGYARGGPSTPPRRGIDELRLSKQLKSDEDVPSRTENLAPKRQADPQAIRRALMRFAKSLNENASLKKKYLEDGGMGSLQCLACGRDSKDYPDVHSLVMHCFNYSNADHFGLQKAVCVLMGWDYSKVPDGSKTYQSLSEDDAAENREDLIIWPPIVVIHNTNLGKRKDGRMDGLGNKDVDNKLKDLGFSGGKSKSLYGKDGHLGITIVKFASNMTGLKEAELLAEYFEKDQHGRSEWARAQESAEEDGDDEKNELLFSADEKSKEKKRILYGYLGTASDLDKVDFDTRKKAVIKSRKDPDFSE